MTVANATTPRKPKAFYAHLYGQPGALTKVNGSLYFVTDEAVMDVEPDMVKFLVTLGEMALADAQRIEDLTNGGYAAIACSRVMQVA